MGNAPKRCGVQGIKRFDHRERIAALLRVPVVVSAAGNAVSRGVVEEFGHETEREVHAGGNSGRRKKLPVFDPT